MILASLPPTWQGWIAAFQAPLHDRLAWRLEPIMLGVVMAKGRRTVTSWLRAAGLRKGWQDYYYFLAAVGQACECMAMLLLRLLVRHLLPEGPLVFGIDDTPTKRYGPKVEGAGMHHNPTPGPARHKLLYGHLWVTLVWIVQHPRWGAIGLPVLARLYVRQVDVQKLTQRWPFLTKLVLAKQLVVWAAEVLHFLGRQLWFVTDGGYTKQPFLKVARQLPGVVIISRLRRDAALYTVPKPVPPGKKRGRGRPPTYGKQRINLAKRAGQKRGWQQVTCRQYGKEVVKKIKTFEATYKPAGGRIRVVLVEETDGWLPYFSTDPAMAATTILEQKADRGTLEQDYHDLKEVEGTGQQQLRNIWANIGAFHLTMWAHCLTELWAWYQPKEALCDRSDSPWDNPQRRPSHADRRKALQRSCLAEEFSHLQRRQPVAAEIQRFIDGIIHQAA
jgi:hypothetical protein